MPRYCVSFFKRLLSSDGHQFKCLQEQIVVLDLENFTQAAESASRLFEMHHSIRDWRLHADEIEVAATNNAH
jgi:hypothetical protein